jgi:hypothetical protein
MILNAKQLKNLIKEEFLRLLEADVIRRRAGADDVRKIDRAPDVKIGSRDEPVIDRDDDASMSIEKFQFIPHLYDKSYKMKRALEKGFIAPSAAYTAKYNRGVEKFRMRKERRNVHTGELEKYGMLVHIDAVKVGDHVEIPELFNAGIRGVGIVMATNHYRSPEVVRAQGGIAHEGLERNQSVPVATVKWESSQTDSGTESRLTNIGWAFLVKIKRDSVEDERRLFKKV